MPDQYNLAQLTKEMIVHRLKEAPNAPQVAAEVAKKTIIAGVQSTRAAGQDPQETIAEICFGAMSGLMLIEKDLPQGAVHILRCASEAANDIQIDPTELMTWAMEGVARITQVVTQETGYSIRSAIEEEYHGAGEVFGRLCLPYGKKSR